MANAELLYATLRDIAEHPRDWNQRAWRSCFAGHAARRAGYITVGPFAARSFDVVRPWRWRHIGDVAQEELGLTRRQALRMFDGRNSYADLTAEVCTLSPTVGVP